MNKLVDIEGFKPCNVGISQYLVLDDTSNIEAIFKS